MNTPNANHPHHHDMHEMDRGSPANMLWGLILTILTFLLVVVCILSIDIFADAAEGDNPPHEDGEHQGGDTPPDGSDPGIENPPGGEDNPGVPGPEGPGGEDTTPDKPDTSPGPTPNKPSYVIGKTSASVLLDAALLNSKHAVLVDVNAREIVAGYEFDMPMYPASMTKVMTLLVACENLTDAQMNDIVTIPADIVAYMEREGASGVMLEVGEELTVKDLLYAIALESDGVASATLARYVGGTEEAFVAMMNQKADDMSLLGTNFCNTTGLHHDEHVTTCREMASIMIAAMDNALVKTLLSEKSYNTTTNVYPKGRTFYSTYFKDVVENVRQYGYQAQPSGGTIIAAKTGSTPEAKSCLVTYYEAASDHKPYIVVTAEASNYYVYVQDYIMLYEDYAH